MDKFNQFIGDMKHKLSLVRAKKWILAKHFKGLPQLSDFELQEEEIEQLQEREILLEAMYLSVDPYMRAFSAFSSIGKTMTGAQVAKVIGSRNNDYPVDTVVRAQVGWRTLTKVNPDDTEPKHFGQPLVVKLGDMNGAPPSIHLGVLGLPGATAYLAMESILKPQKGETLVVNAAAGAVGNVVGQLAKMKGMKVVGFTGSEEKCKWLNELGFDEAVNYKSRDVEFSLKKSAPDGVDCYFDHVGGEFSSSVINNMKTGGRVAVVGAISAYNNERDKVDKGTLPYLKIMAGALTIQGFHATAHYKRWQEAFDVLYPLVKQGKLKVREYVTLGFEDMPKAFIGQLKGENIGKAIVKA